VKEIIINFGTPLATLAIAILSAVLSRFVWSRISADWARRLLQAAYAEIADAVLIVWQTYVEELKEKSADGKLTEAERAEAKDRAIDIVLRNLGETGLKRLARVLGFEDSGNVTAIDHTVAWLEDKTEAAVASLKSAGVLMAGARKGTVAQSAPVPPVIADPS